MTEAICGGKTSDGSPCQRHVAEGDERCFLHNEEDIPSSHGAPKGNINAVTHSLYAETENFIERVAEWEAAVVVGLYDYLLEQSCYTFDVEFEAVTFDLSDAPYTVENGVEEATTVAIPIPTVNAERATALLLAAIDGLKMLRANAVLAENCCEKTVTEKAQLTSPTEEDPSQEWRRIDEKSEHHLNLAYSRLIRDRLQLLSYGGVATDVEVDEDSIEMKQISINDIYD